MTSDTFLFKFCKATKSHLLDFLFCLFGFSLSFLLLILLNYSLYFMDELCLWIFCCCWWCFSCWLLLYYYFRLIVADMTRSRTKLPLLWPWSSTPHSVAALCLKIGEPHSSHLSLRTLPFKKVPTNFLHKCRLQLVQDPCILSSVASCSLQKTSSQLLNNMASNVVAHVKPNSLA